jgi:hypothetical protein
MLAEDRHDFRPLMCLFIRVFAIFGNWGSRTRTYDIAVKEKTGIEPELNFKEPSFPQPLVLPTELYPNIQNTSLDFNLTQFSKLRY